MSGGFAIGGKAGSGKTTMGRKIVAACDEAGIPAIRVAFGDALKREVMELYGIDKHMPGGRDVLIRHGEERRAADPQYWIRPVAELARLAQVSGVAVVVDDMRFATEFEWAVQAGFVTIRMVASPDWRRSRLLDQGLDPSIVESESVTETELDGVRHNHVVRNFATATLDARARQLIQAI